MFAVINFYTERLYGLFKSEDAAEAYKEQLCRDDEDGRDDRYVVIEIETDF